MGNPLIIMQEIQISIREDRGRQGNPLISMRGIRNQKGNPLTELIAPQSMRLPSFPPPQESGYAAKSPIPPHATHHKPEPRF